MAITLTWNFVSTTITAPTSGQTVPSGEAVNFNTSAMLSGEYLFVDGLNNLTVNTDITRTTNGSTPRVAGALGSDSFNWQGSVGGVLRSGSLSFEVINAQQIDLGSDLVAVKRNEYVELQSFIAAVGGYATSSDTGDLSGVATCQVNSGNGWTTAGPVSLGSVVQVRVFPSSTYSDQITASVTFAGVTDSCNVTTEPDPSTFIGEGSVIPFGHATGPIPLGDIIQFFSGSSILGIYSPPNAMSDYYRGGSNVPDITGNNGIPTSGQVALSEYRNAQTLLYFLAKPTAKSSVLNTISSGGTITAVWYSFDSAWGTSADWEMGYGEYVKFAAQYQFSLTVTSSVVNAGSITSATALTSATPTSWTDPENSPVTGIVGFGVSVGVAQNTEVFIEGYITMQVRHPDNISNTISHDVGFYLRSFGP